MAKRKIIRIDEGLCNGCGDCISACAEGALQIVNGKARVINERFCDGFGDCLKGCPTGALTIEERDADEFDMSATREHVMRQGGIGALRRLEDAEVAHRKSHNDSGHGACPGSLARIINNNAGAAAVCTTADTPSRVLASELSHWPVQIHLVRPDAEFFKARELVVMSTCGPIASADVHWRFIRGRSVVVGCPKLDDTSGYAQKLAMILKESGTPRVIVVRMEVPCCGGLTSIVKEAVRISERKDIEVEEAYIAINGELIKSQRVIC